MKAIGDTLRALRKRNSLTQLQVAERLTALGLATKDKQVSRWEQGYGEPSLPHFFSLCQLYGVEDVLGTFWSSGPVTAINEQGQALIDAIRRAVEQSGLYAPKQPMPHMRLIRLYDIPVSAGTGQILDDGQYTVIEVDDTVPLEADFGLHIAGDSMEPRFTSGQIVWVHEQNDLEDGQIGAFSLNGDAYIKKWERGNGYARLVSLNEKYAPIEVTEADSLVVFGKVVG